MIHAPPLLLSADFDPFQAAIIVIALIGGFVKWLWENWQQRREAAAPPPPDPEEQALREVAWRKQTGQSKPPPLPPVAATPWDELRRAWKELKDAARTASPSPPPSPVPQRRAANRPPPMPQQRQAQAQPQQPTATTAPARTASAAATAPPPSVARSVSPALAALHKLRHDPALMRQAILMQEVLGAPKALREDSPLV